ncbi:MAG: ATP-binding protein [Pleurocapsa minor GSE-CHR-MK-17-07R]|jgi:hypothetical protein|nr:ATP-binding protein [Pleurocapsa minor GSE-CHR-MK 17-07R]
MPFFDKRPADLDHNDITELIGLPETITLDFKRQLDDQNSSSILKCITAMANTQGGRIIVGIDEDGTLASEIIGIPNEQLENVRSRLRNWCNALIDPRIPNLDIHPVSLEGGEKSVIVISIPAPTLLAPHQEKNSRLFHKRYPAGNDPMTYQELRMMFNQALTLAETLHTYRQRRVDAIATDRTGEIPLNLSAGPRFIVHFNPLNTVAQNARLDLEPVAEIDVDRGPFEFSNHAKRYNLDGVIFPEITTSTERFSGYVQVFRNGTIEAVHYMRPDFIESHFCVLLYWLQDWLIRYSWFAKLIYSVLRIDSSVNVMASMSNMGESKLAHYHRSYQPHPQVAIDGRQIYMFPDVTLESVADLESHGSLRLVCDLMFNAVGVSKSSDFDENGAFRYRGSRETFD